jgi:DNA-directed RNA polymerase subunit RPC12/RpoP
MNRDQLGFKCGKNCAECGDSVALDAQGRYTCFTCGKRVKAADDSQPGALKLRKLKSGQAEFFTQESALIRMMGDER